jgi:hypothetical protein
LIFLQDLKWIFGSSPNVPVLNLTKDPNLKILATASAHVFQIFHCDGNVPFCFVGHVNINYIEHSARIFFLCVYFPLSFPLFIISFHFIIIIITKESEIFTLETDSTGRFIVSADKHGIINIWDMAVAE